MSENADDEVQRLLQLWGLSDLKPKFKANYIVLQALEYLTESDIVELIPKIGQRAIFRGKLLQWRQQNGVTPEHQLKICKPEPKCDPQPKPNKSPPQYQHKVYKNLKKCSPKSKNLPPATTTTIKSSIQSKVQQFYISPSGEAPPPPKRIHKPDLTPFVTSIIRVDTKCDKSYQNDDNVKPSSTKPQNKVNRTTILQKLTNSNRTATSSQENTFQDNPEGSKQEREKEKEIQCPEDKPPDANLLYPIVKLETELADTNWTEYSEIEPDHDYKTELNSTAKTEQEDIVADSTDLLTGYADSMESDSALDFDSENEGSVCQLEHMTPAIYPPRRKRGRGIGKLDIRNILMNSDIGRHVLNYYEAHERLDIGRRRMLIEAIVHDCWLTNRHISPSDCSEIAEEIIEILPNERLENYFMSQSGKNPKSPLYNKFRNMHRRSRIDKGLPILYSRKKKAPLTLEEDNVEVDDNIIIS